MLLALLSCQDTKLNFLVTLTPIGTEEVVTVTTLPTVIYPTLTPIPEVSPTAEDSGPVSIVCQNESVAVVCRATVCVVRLNPDSGEENKAYTVPNGAIIEGAQVCTCAECAAFEKDWFYLGKSGDKHYWALQMDLVWEVYQGE